MSELRERIARAIHDLYWTTYQNKDGAWCEGNWLNGKIEREEYLEEADAVLSVLGQEFAHGRPASMPDMSGRQQWTIVGGPYSSRDVAERMAKTRPVVKDLPVTVLTRIVSEWEEADDE